MGGWRLGWATASAALQRQALHWLGTTCWACDARLAVGDLGPWCGGCAVAVEDGAASAVPWAAEGSTEDLPVAALWTYAGAVAQALGQAKGRGHALPIGVVAEPWRRLVGAAMGDWAAQAVCAVPPQPQRLAERGWSLPDQLAQASGARLVRPLQRCDSLAPRRVDRQAAPRLRCTRAPLGAPRLVIVDDVLTSGATLQACRAALQAHGWQVAGAVVLADARPAAIALALGGAAAPGEAVATCRQPLGSVAARA